MKVYEYTVDGSGYFPIDMLRYDAAWPADTDSAIQIVERLKPITREDRLERKPIKLRSYHAPTEGRWQSFMWGVGKVTSYNR